MCRTGHGWHHARNRRRRRSEQTEGNHNAERQRAQLNSQFLHHLFPLWVVVWRGKCGSAQRHSAMEIDDWQSPSPPGLGTLGEQLRRTASSP